MITSNMCRCRIQEVRQVSGIMKLVLKTRQYSLSPSFAALVGAELEVLATRRQIDEARVLIERRPEASPAFRVAAHLVTPGPDIAAEAVDHTLCAAFAKTVTLLEARIGRRKIKRGLGRRAPIRTASPSRPMMNGRRA